MHWILRLLVTALATALAAWLVPGIDVIGETDSGRLVSVLVAAALFGVVNTVVKPIFQFLSACLIVLTLGLFLLVINALMLMLTSWLSQQFGTGIIVDGFWPALFGSIIISLVAALLGARKQRE